ncbi:cellulase family glycosylhydrolase [Chitinophaga barathri]|nr:cellulase family glycosylhydrolase [Chitinophaga barathri]
METKKKWLLLSSSTLFLTLSLSAQQVIPLYEGAVPDQLEQNVKEKIENRNGIELTSNVVNPSLEMYKPPKGIATGTAVIICPGGGYWVLATGHEGKDVAREFNKIGVTAFVLKYRLPDSVISRQPSISPIQDAQQAMLLVRSRAVEWGIDPRKVGILGFSAGGHLAACAGTQFNRQYVANRQGLSLRPDFMMLIYPVTSFVAPYAHAGSYKKLLGNHATDEQQALFSPVLQVSPTTPPAFLVHAADDTGVPAENSVQFYEALRENQVPAELHIYQEGGHGFGLRLPTGEKWMERCRNWLKVNGWLEKSPVKTHCYVTGRFLHAPDGEKIILRGVNKMNVVTDKTGERSFKEIAKTGANCVRIMWMKFGGGGQALDTVIGNAVRHGLLPVLELHDATGKWDKLPECLAFWLQPDVVKVIKKYERYLVINIANEAGDNTITMADFVQTYTAIVKKMRNAGIRVPLMIDAANWGRNEQYLLENGASLLKNDPGKNLLFSWHIWDSGISEERISRAIDQSIEKDIPLVIGEFAPMEVKCKCCIPYRFIMKYAHKQQIGWMAWSWGPGNSDCPGMDMTSTGVFDSLHGWGRETALDDPFSIKKTSVKPMFLYTSIAY